jgi:hypothetical protein
MAYLFPEQREDFAEKIIDAIGIDDDFVKETFKREFVSFQEMNLGNYEMDKICDWIKSGHSFEARNFIKDNLRKPKELYSFFRSKI